MIALGASNLTRGFHIVVSTARAAWGRDVDVFAALGHGRSYGAPSRVLIRTLPGILESGLWAALERRAPIPTRALITDVGNDILYGSSPAQILEWVETAAARLQHHTNDIVITDLPVANIERLSRARFALFRSILFPSCRLTREEVAERAMRVNEGLAALAASRSLRLFRLKPEWYGLDPIHIRARLWHSAWQEILAGGDTRASVPTSSWQEGVRLYLLRPERQWLFGIEQCTPQSGVSLPRGARVWLY